MERSLKGIDIYCYFITFLLIYLEWGYAPVVAQTISGSVKSLLMVIFIIPLFFLKSFNVNKNTIALLFYLTTIILISVLIDGDLANNVLLFLPIFCAFVYVSAYSIEKSIRAFCNIITFLATVSIIVYILTFTLPSVIQSFQQLQNPHGWYVYDLGLCVASSGGIVRNFGITWEPGAFALLLCLAIFGLIVGYTELNKTKIIINIVALFTTLSTMGIVVIFAIIFLTKFRTGVDQQSKYSNALLFLFIIAVGCFLMLDSEEILEVIFGKLSGFSISDENPETTQARLNAVIYPGLAFLSSPIIGIGYGEFKILNETLCNNVATNTIINWFALGGLLLGTPCAYYYFKAITKATKYLDLKYFHTLLLILTFGLLVSTESLLRISLIYVIIFYGCSNAYITKHA